MTEAEKKLWLHLRQRQLNGYKFRRQYPIGSYIADFACIESKLVIELDGGQHAELKAQDRKRDALIQQKGFLVLRFWNTDIIKNMEGVLQTISHALHDPHLTSPFQGEEQEAVLELLAQGESV